MKMAPQLYITVYKEQFRSPGKVRRTELRPTSAHRRNNPQPRPDFLFPRSLQPHYRSTCTPRHPMTTVDSHRPLFPPVRHLTFHSPVATCLDNSSNTTNADKLQHMPPVNPPRVQALTSAERLGKLQLKEPPAGTDSQLHSDLNNVQRRMDNQRSLHPLSAQQLKQHRGAQLPRRPRTSNPLTAPHRYPQSNDQGCCSNSSLDSSGCYSCFHVVKPYQAGHYTIHPEFVSECLY